MKEKEIDNCALAEYCGVSEGTIRYWKKNKKKLWEDAVSDYLLSSDTENEKKPKRVIAVLGLKGGVGKSTVSNIISYAIPNSVIFNIDITAKESMVNSSKTLDYSSMYESDESVSASEVLNVLEEETIFIDTPSDVSEELLDVIPYCNDFIVIFYDGRATNASLGTMNMLFNLDEITTNDKHKIFVIYNRAKNKTSAEHALKEFNTKVLDLKAKSKNGEAFEIEYSYLENSKVIRAMENEQMSVVDLFTKKGIMYKTFRDRANRLVNEADKFLELQ